jgi:hypothetical protein
VYDLPRSVDRQALVVDPEAVTVRVGVGEDPELQHLVGAVTDAGDDIGGRERRLLDLGKVVLRVAIQLHDTDLTCPLWRYQILCSSSHS